MLLMSATAVTLTIITAKRLSVAVTKLRASCPAHGDTVSQAVKACRDDIAPCDNYLSHQNMSATRLPSSTSYRCVR